MKYLVLIPDGMADYPLRQLSWRTPLMAARAPHIKSLGFRGRMGLFLSLPKGTQAGSDVAIMSIMGYDPSKQLTGRGAIESAALGIKLEEDEIAFRCNLVTCPRDRISDYSAGYINSTEGALLIEALKKELEDEDARFHPGKSFRNILVLKGGSFSDDLATTPPHDIVGQGFHAYLPAARSAGAKQTEEKVRDLIARSRDVLARHPVNTKRRKAGLNPGNMIWPWSPGHRLNVRPFSEIWGVSAAAIAAVDTIKGLARSAGMLAPNVPGATGFVDTDYEAKARAALDLLRSCDMAFVHVEGIDEMGHSGDLKGKMKAIEDFDSRLVAHLFAGLESRGWEYRVSVIPDHYTPCTVRTHVRDPTPFVIAQSGTKAPKGAEYNEENAKLGDLGTLKGDEFIRCVLQRQGRASSQDGPA